MNVENLYILGANSFIGKNLYLYLKPYINNTFLVSHDELYDIVPTQHDIIINTCGVNRAESEQDYIAGNYGHIKKLVDWLNTPRCESQDSASLYSTFTPYVIHLSSLAVNGVIPGNNYWQTYEWFIKSKLASEKYIYDNYNTDRHCIVRPASVYGYSCRPYYNNILSSLVYEKVVGKCKLNELNGNSYRNVISIDGLCSAIHDLFKDNFLPGVHNIVSNNTVSIEQMVNYTYMEDSHNIEIFHGEKEEFKKSPAGVNNIIVTENLQDKISQLVVDMKYYLKLEKECKVVKRSPLKLEKGDMVEISELNSNRLYKIYFTKNSVRGNHYHDMQLEDFYINAGRICMIVAHKDRPEVRMIKYMEPNDIMRINPYYIHTLTNDFILNFPEVFVTSTQQYIPNSSPDTINVNLI